MPIAFTCFTKVRPEDPIAIAQQIARCGLPGEGFAQLPGDPFRGRMSGDAKMQNTPPVVRQHQEHIQGLEADGRHRKKVNGNH